MAESTFTNRLMVSRTFKGDNDSIQLLGTFCGGLQFPKDGGKPFTTVERTTKNQKVFKQIRATLVIAPDNRKTNNGYPNCPIYYDGNNKTFAEFLNAVGIELFNGRLYVTVSMDRSTIGLYQLMGDPNLTFKDHIMCSGQMSFFRGQDGKMRAALGNVSLFARDKIFDDKVEKANANCQLADARSSNNGTAAGGAPGGYSAPAPNNSYPAQTTGGFVEIDDDDGELPF